MWNTRKYLKRFHAVLYLLVILTLLISTTLPVFAEDPNEMSGGGGSQSGFVNKLLSVVSMITDDVIVIIVGLTTLITVIAVVRSGVMAQLNAQIGRKFGLSNELLMVLETITIFVVAMITLPLVKSVIKRAVSLAGGAYTMLGWNLRFPN